MGLWNKKLKKHFTFFQYFLFSLFLSAFLIHDIFSDTIFPFLLYQLHLTRSHWSFFMTPPLKKYVEKTSSLEGGLERDHWDEKGQQNMTGFDEEIMKIVVL